MYPEPPAPLEIDERKMSLKQSGVLQAPSTTLEMVSSHRSIAMHYFKGWFMIDLLSVLTILVDVIPVAQGALQARTGSHLGP